MVSPLRLDTNSSQQIRMETEPRHGDTNSLLKQEIAQLANENKKINSSPNTNAPSYQPKTKEAVFAQQANSNRPHFFLKRMPRCLSNFKHGKRCR